MVSLRAFFGSFEMPQRRSHACRHLHRYRALGFDALGRHGINSYGSMLE
jgi:hypothetical protein